VPEPLAPRRLCVDQTRLVDYEAEPGHACGPCGTPDKRADDEFGVRREDRLRLPILFRHLSKGHRERTDTVAALVEKLRDARVLRRFV